MVLERKQIQPLTMTSSAALTSNDTSFSMSNVKIRPTKEQSFVGGRATLTFIIMIQSEWTTRTGRSSKFSLEETVRRQREGEMRGREKEKNREGEKEKERGREREIKRGRERGGGGESQGQRADTLKAESGMRAYLDVYLERYYSHCSHAHGNNLMGVLNTFSSHS